MNHEMSAYAIHIASNVVIVGGFVLTVYVRLARREEREVRARFGLVWDQYASRTPAFFPPFGRRGHTRGGEEHAHA